MLSDTGSYYRSNVSVIRAVAFGAVLVVLASALSSASLTAPHESHETIAVAPESTDSYEKAVDHGAIRVSEATPIDTLSPTVRAVVTDAQSGSTEELRDHGDDWHVHTVGVCRETMLVCDGVEEWPAIFDDPDDADGRHSPNSKTTYHHYLLEDGDERLVVTTISTGGFGDDDFVSQVIRTAVLVPYAIVIVGATHWVVDRRPRTVVGIAGLGTLFAAWGFAYPYVELSGAVDVDYHRTWFLTLGWGSLFAVCSWLGVCALLGDDFEDGN